MGMLVLGVAFYLTVGLLLALFCSLASNVGTIWGPGEGLGVILFLLIMFCWPLVILGLVAVYLVESYRESLWRG